MEESVSRLVWICEKLVKKTQPRQRPWIGQKSKHEQQRQLVVGDLHYPWYIILTYIWQEHQQRQSGRGCYYNWLLALRVRMFSMLDLCGQEHQPRRGVKVDS